jgi:hypothetical protein
MSSSSGRGQVEPLAALAAVFAVGIGLVLYAGALDATLPALEDEREMAPAATDRFVAEASSFGAVAPPFGDAAAAARPTGYHLNATVRARTTAWTVGRPAPPSAECQRRRVGARTAPGRIRPARVEVCVWRAQ